MSDTTQVPAVHLRIKVTWRPLSVTGEHSGGSLRISGSRHLWQWRPRRKATNPSLPGRSGAGGHREVEVAGVLRATGPRTGPSSGSHQQSSGTDRGDWEFSRHSGAGGAHRDRGHDRGGVRAPDLQQFSRAGQSRSPPGGLLQCGGAGADHRPDGLSAHLAPGLSRGLPESRPARQPGLARHAVSGLSGHFLSHPESRWAFIGLVCSLWSPHLSPPSRLAAGQHSVWPRLLQELSPPVCPHPGTVSHLQEEDRYQGLSPSLPLKIQKSKLLQCI